MHLDKLICTASTISACVERSGMIMMIWNLLPLPSGRAFAHFSIVMANPTNVLSSGIEITGSIRFSNDMIIDGKIEGEISSLKGRVTIGENAIIKGDVTAGEVKVYGKVEGKITSERCELKDKSRIQGDIKSKVFSMEEGAQLSGRTEIGA
jgi:cytoskeletal protein CcmA (bactofilin family)